MHLGEHHQKEIGGGVGEEPPGQAPALLHARETLREDALEPGAIVRAGGVDGAGGEGMDAAGLGDEPLDARGQDLEPALEEIVGAPVEDLGAPGAIEPGGERDVQDRDGSTAARVGLPEGLQMVPGRPRPSSIASGCQSHSP